MSLRGFILLAVAGLLAAGPARAEGLSEAEKTRDEEVAQRAKKRQYPGGADESDLKLQTPLPTPTRKMAPQVEEPETASDSNDADN